MLAHAASGTGTSRTLRRPPSSFAVPPVARATLPRPTSVARVKDSFLAPDSNGGEAALRSRPDRPSTGQMPDDTSGAIFLGVDARNDSDDRPPDLLHG